MSDRPLELTFVKSAVDHTTFADFGPEVAFVGRSNVGKSSLINALANRHGLAQVSNTPGRTRVLNQFSHRDRGAVIDLPGYGFAKVHAAERAKWQKMIEGYLTEREQLAMVIALVDGEIGPTKLDEQTLTWLQSIDVPYAVVATKIDRVKATVIGRRKADLAAGCQLEIGDIRWVSSSKGTGVDSMRTWLRGILLGE
jgi:GTP-binding protein